MDFSAIGTNEVASTLLGMAVAVALNIFKIKLPMQPNVIRPDAQPTPQPVPLPTPDAAGDLAAVVRRECKIACAEVIETKLAKWIEPKPIT
jgi:hypothetical protein